MIADVCGSGTDGNDGDQEFIDLFDDNDNNDGGIEEETVVEETIVGMLVETWVVTKELVETWVVTKEVILVAMKEVMIWWTHSTHCFKTATAIFQTLAEEGDTTNCFVCECHRKCQVQNL